MKKVSRGIGFSDVLIRPIRSSVNSRQDVCILTSVPGLYPLSIPVIVANMDTTGTMDMAKSICAERGFVALHKHYEPDQIGMFLANGSNAKAHKRIFVTIGLGDDELDRLSRIRSYVNTDFNISADVANGHTDGFVKHVKAIRNSYPKSVIMAGAVADKRAAVSLVKAGANIVRVGIGGGSVCTTREKAGVGVPQVSAILECSGPVHRNGGLLCSDGGIRSSGDAAKAIAAGADLVMCGYMFASTDECNGEWVEKDGKKYMVFYGMASEYAQNKYSGGVKHYSTEEGKTILIPYRGRAADVLSEIAGGLRSACTYCNASVIDQLQKANLVAVSRN